MHIQDLAFPLYCSYILLTWELCAREVPGLLLPMAQLQLWNCSRCMCPTHIIGLGLSLGRAPAPACPFLQAFPPCRCGLGLGYTGLLCSLEKATPVSCEVMPPSLPLHISLLPSPVVHSGRTFTPWCFQSAFVHKWKEQPIQAPLANASVRWMSQAKILWDSLSLPWLFVDWGS